MVLKTETIQISGELIQPFTNALLNASGIKEEQAKVCVLYAMVTHREDLDKIPILAVIGGTGTGKIFENQMKFMVKEPFICTAITPPTMRDEMEKHKTYLIHEADRIDEQLIQKRSDKELSSITYKKDRGNGWIDNTIDIFGSTILARRTPFKDSAVRNRAIRIHTSVNTTRNEYKITNIEGVQQIVSRLKIEKIKLGAGRVMDTWSSLIEVARSFDDQTLETSVNNAIKAEQNLFRRGQQYEPEDVVLQALDNLTWDNDKGERTDKDVELSDLAQKAVEVGDVKLSKKQIEEILINKGLNITYTHGIKYIRSDEPEKLEGLLRGVK